MWMPDFFKVSRGCFFNSFEFKYLWFLMYKILICIFMFNRGLEGLGKVFLWLGRQEQARRCLQKQWRPNAGRRSSTCPRLRSLQSTGASQRSWCGFCSRWPGWWNHDLKPSGNFTLFHFLLKILLAVDYLH